MSTNKNLQLLRNISADNSDLSEESSISDGSEYEPIDSLYDDSEDELDDAEDLDVLQIQQTETLNGNELRRGRGGRSRGRGRESRGSTRGCNAGSSNLATCGSSARRQNIEKNRLSKLAIGEKVASSDGTEWEVVGPNNRSIGRRNQQNVLKEEPGPTSYANRNISEDNFASAWSLMIDDFMLKKIKLYTELEARRCTGNDDWTMSDAELRAFIGILYVRGASGAKGLELHSLWSNEWGIKFIKDSMSRNGFIEILTYLRFDDKSFKLDRLKTDKYSLFSEIWDRFVSNIQSCYKPGPHITVDEQLFPSKARCPFTQSMPAKPDKYGQKFWLAVDNDSKYLLNAMPYLGKDENRTENQRLGDYVVLKLTEPYLNKGRNVTCDNFFTSLHLAKELKKKKTSLVGTVNRARKEIPNVVKQARENLYSSQVMTTGDATLRISQGKSHKNVIILSTMHSDVQRNVDEKKKPQIVTFYNKTKSGVDVIDQMARKYSGKASSRRWPVHTFYTVLDLAVINAWVLYKMFLKVTISRRDFILKLGDELFQLNRETRNRQTGNGSTDEVPKTLVKGNLRRCQVRQDCSNGRSPNLCAKCNKVVCKKCTAKKAFVCINCES